MDTVSYLTINDETKEIADIVSRNNIENISATLDSYSSNIENIQFEIGSAGPIVAGINQAYLTAVSAQANAATAAEAAATADEKAFIASQAAVAAQSSADEAAEAAFLAWNKAEEATNSSTVAKEKVDLIDAAVNAVQSTVDDASVAVLEAQNRAEEAITAANIASNSATRANNAANSAENSAAQANSYAQGALNGLATLQSVVDTVNWFAEHKVLTTDLQVDSEKTYYIYNSTTGSMSKVNPMGYENPSQEGWYELDETIKDYIITRVAETNDGLSIFSPIGGWRILLSNGAGRYLPGLFIFDSTGVIKQASTYQSISFDEKSAFHIGDKKASIIFDGNGHIAIGGTGVEIAAPVTIGGKENKTFLQILNDLDASIKTIEYGIGNSSSSYLDIIEWTKNVPDWEENKYIWMRTTSNGLTYTYACIQGAQPGPRGETGPMGETGPIGTGIESIQVQYGLSKSESVPPEAWKDSIEDLNISVFTESNFIDEIDNIGETGEISNIGKTGEVDDTGIVGTTGITGITGETGYNENIWIPLPQGSWLWTRTTTTYTDGTIDVTYQKTYIGKDGADGTSIFIKSVSKENGITTIELIDDAGNEEILQIADGEDGNNGTPGVDGKSIHIAWADSIKIIDDDDNPDTPSIVQAIGFSNSDGTNKEYIGVYSDFELEDSNDPNDYSWSLIKGPKGSTGQAAIRVEIDAIGGNFIKKGQVNIPLIAHVYEGINDITNQFNHFTWYRRKADGTRDTSWSTQETSNQLIITTADVDESAVFVCEVTVTR